RGALGASHTQSVRRCDPTLGVSPGLRRETVPVRGSVDEPREGAFPAGSAPTFARDRTGGAPGRVLRPAATGPPPPTGASRGRVDARGRRPTRRLRAPGQPDGAHHQ